jgi:hypothetical protein
LFAGFGRQTIEELGDPEGAVGVVEFEAKTLRDEFLVDAYNGFGDGALKQKSGRAVEGAPDQCGAGGPFLIGQNGRVERLNIHQVGFWIKVVGPEGADSQTLKWAGDRGGFRVGKPCSPGVEGVFVGSFPDRFNGASGIEWCGGLEGSVVYAEEKRGCFPVRSACSRKEALEDFLRHSAPRGVRTHGQDDKKTVGVPARRDRGDNSRGVEGLTGDRGALERFAANG